jgi:hypothetical protein
MELTNLELSFIQKNIVGMLNRRGGVMRYRELCHRLHSSRVSSDTWVKEYTDLINLRVIREYRIDSVKRRDTKINVVELVAKNLPVYEVRPVSQLKREKEEEDYATAGWDAFIEGADRRKDCPRVGSPYTPRWYRLRAAWQQGFDDAASFEDRSKGKPEKGTRVFVNPLK